MGSLKTVLDRERAAEKADAAAAAARAPLHLRAAHAAAALWRRIRRGGRVELPEDAEDASRVAVEIAGGGGGIGARAAGRANGGGTGATAPREVLHGVSFVIPAGRTTAIVGATGSGKSTVRQPRWWAHRPP